MWNGMKWHEHALKHSLCIQSPTDSQFEQNRDLLWQFAFAHFGFLCQMWKVNNINFERLNYEFEILHIVKRNVNEFGFSICSKRLTLRITILMTAFTWFRLRFAGVQVYISCLDNHNSMCNWLGTLSSVDDARRIISLSNWRETRSKLNFGDLCVCAIMRNWSETGHEERWGMEIDRQHQSHLRTRNCANW